MPKEKAPKEKLKQISIRLPEADYYELKHTLLELRMSNVDILQMALRIARKLVEDKKAEQKRK